MLFAVGSYKFRVRHLLVIGILCASFSISFLLRSQPAEYGFELHEFDPFFNYRATTFLLENGLQEYLDWHDHLSWYPDGRDVSATSQVMLHVTAAAAYTIFGFGVSLYDFVIVLPVVFGSLTTIVMFALVRTIAGSTAGLFASLLFSMSLPIILRGTLGWFKSEPLGLFYGLIAAYLFLSSMGASDRRAVASRMAGGGIMLGFGIASWGGIQFFVLILGIFLLALVFLRRDVGLVWSVPVFVSSFLFTVMFFERPGLDFVFGLGGIALVVPTAFFVACCMIWRKSQPENVTRNCLVLLLGVVLLGSLLLVVNWEAELVNIPSSRYISAINPFHAGSNTLTESVSEHTTTSILESFFFHSILMVFAALGAWIILGKRTGRAGYLRTEMIAFALILGMAGVYVSSAFIRLEVFASISVIVLSSIGLSVLVREITNNHTLGESRHILRNRGIKSAFFTGIILLLLIPFLMPASANWIALTSAPPTILNGGTFYSVGTNDWLESLDWIRNNTPDDSVIAAWWDYGYWISTVSERATLADNSTIDSDKIKVLAKMFLSTPDEAWRMLQDVGADYVVVFVAGQRLDIESDVPLYVLDGGGDESKKLWFVRIAEEPLPKYLYPDGETATDYFWNETLMGKLFPFSALGYVHFDSNLQVRGYLPGLTPVYVQDVKYPADDTSKPFRLVHASPGYFRDGPGPVLGVFVYEVNSDYLPGSVFS